jgi:hypothetical protein
MASITRLLPRIKDDLDALIDSTLVEDFCRQLGHRFRRRRLDPTTTLRLWLRQALAGNTACTHLRHLADLPASVSAYAQARQRLPAGLLQRLLGQTAAGADPAVLGDAARWHGHRTLLLDGTGCSMPDTPALADRYGYPANQPAGCAFPVAHLLALFEAEGGLLLELIDAPGATHDMALTQAAHAHLRPGDVLVGDRGLCAYTHLALLAGRGCHGLFRAHPSQRVDFTPGRPCAAQRPKADRAGRPTSRFVRRLGHRDQLVEYSKPKDKPAWLDQSLWEQLPPTLLVRELRYRVSRRGFRSAEVTLVTTLTDARRYHKTDLAGLYRQRWEVETHLRELKQTLGLDVLKTKSPAMVRKEMLILAVVYNLVRALMGRAAVAQAAPLRRVSFSDALRHLAATGGLVPRIVLLLNPDRRDRLEPRVVKRRPNPCAYMTRPRDQLRRKLLIVAA